MEPETESHGPGKNPFQQAYLAEVKAQLSSNERKKEIEGIRKTIIDKMKGAEGEEGASFLVSFRLHPCLL